MTYGQIQEDLDNKLRRAARRGKLEKIDALLEQGADINGKCEKYFSLKMTPLGEAIWHRQAKALEHLLEKGADPNKPCMNDDLPLHQAASQGDPQLVRILMEHGANPWAKNAHGVNAFQIANLAQEPHVYEIIKNLAPPEPKPPEAPTPLASWSRNAPESPDLVVLHGKVQGCEMEEVYNFATHERLTLLRACADGPVSAITRQNFADLGPKSQLREAFEEHVKRGGKTREREVFPDVLGKIILPKKRF